MIQLSVVEFKQWQKMAHRYFLLDVRFPVEKEQADLGGVLIPLPELEQRWREIPQDQGPIVIYCHHGVRSQYAAQYLASQGFEVVNLAGGIDAWSRLIDPTIPLY